MAIIKIKFTDGDVLKVKKEVKPCPFCGGEELLITRKKDFIALYENHGSATISIECPECTACMYEHDYNGKDYMKKVNRLLNKWNERSDENGIEEDQ